MSLVNSVSNHSRAARRAHARRRLDGLTYVEFGPDNGAILIDLGESGLGFQSVMPVTPNQAVLFKFKLPGHSNHFEGYGEVAWINESGKGGGLRFVELNPETLTQIRDWTGVLPPETKPANGNGSDSLPAQESSSANSENEVVNFIAELNAAETAELVEAAASAAAEDLEDFSNGESAQPPSPSAAHAIQAEAIAPELAAPEVVDEEAPASDPVPVLAIPEFTIDAAAEAESAEPLRAGAESAPHPQIALEYAGHTSAKASAAEPAAEIDSPELEDAPAALPPAHVVHLKSSAGRAAAANAMATPDAAATPAKPARVAAPETRNLAPAQKRQRRPAPAKPDFLSSNEFVRTDPQDAPVRASFVRQPQKPVLSAMGAENSGDAGESIPSPTLASQASKVAIAAAAGACLMLGLVYVVPSLRTRVEATANPRTAGVNLASAPAFEVEVADLNNRRWILRSGGEAGSPFGEAPSRRETSSSRNESAKASRVEEPARSEEPADSAASSIESRAKLSTPAALALSRPRVNQPNAASAQLMTPSIFDGITPPIGSVSDHLASGGPEAPGIVENPAAVRTSALQSAVLLQRVAPVYPPAAMQVRLQGDVIVNATIGLDGTPKDLKVVKGDGRLVQAALDAIRQWHYRPANLGGRPIETQIDITISFQLK